MVKIEATNRHDIQFSVVVIVICNCNKLLLITFCSVIVIVIFNCKT